MWKIEKEFKRLSAECLLGRDWNKSFFTKEKPNYYVHVTCSRIMLSQAAGDSSGLQDVSHEGVDDVQGRTSVGEATGELRFGPAARTART